MKLLFESWRKFIAEDEQEEFDPSFDQAIKDCDECGNGMIGVECDEPHYSSGCLEGKGGREGGRESGQTTGAKEPKLGLGPLC